MLCLSDLLFVFIAFVRAALAAAGAALAFSFSDYDSRYSRYDRRAKQRNNDDFYRIHNNLYFQIYAFGIQLLASSF